MGSEKKGRRKAGGTPAPAPSTIKKRREMAGLTQGEAAALIKLTRVQFTRWEQEDGPEMPPPSWELFLIKTGEGYNEPKETVPAGEHPSPNLIKAAREAAGLDPETAAALLSMSPSTWYYWEHTWTDVDPRNMHACLWELFLHKSGLTMWQYENAPCSI